MVATRAKNLKNHFQRILERVVTPAAMASSLDSEAAAFQACGPSFASQVTKILLSRRQSRLIERLFILDATLLTSLQYYQIILLGHTQAMSKVYQQRVLTPSPGPHSARLQ